MLALTEKQQKIKASESLSRLRNMRTKLHKAEHELRKIRQGDPTRVDALEADLQEVLTSRSWKVTAPLRRALHIWRSWMGHH